MKKKKTNQGNLFDQKPNKKEVKMTKEISDNTTGHTEPVEVRQLINHVHELSKQLKFSKAGVFYNQKPVSSD